MGPVIKPAELVNLLAYDPDSGRLFWLPRLPPIFPISKDNSIFNKRYAGTEAFRTQDKYGYRMGRILGRAYKAHRVGWAIHTGAWPVGDIDHIDGDPSNNRICNLRDVSRAENLGFVAFAVGDYVK